MSNRLRLISPAVYSKRIVRDRIMERPEPFERVVPKCERLQFV